MRPCAACGRPSLPLAPLLIAAPLAMGALAALVLALARGSGAHRQATIAVGAGFALLVGGLLWIGLRVVTGAACAGCGRRKP